MTTWTKTTSERYYEMLECLPPEIMTSHGFLVGEPMYHNRKGEPVFTGFVEYDGEFYEADECFTVKQFRELDVSASIKAMDSKS